MPAGALDAPHERLAVGALWEPQILEVEQRRHRAARGRRAGVGQEHDGGFEALGAVHGHDAHLVAAVLHVALHLAVGLAQVGEEAGERRRRVVVVAQRQIEELVDRIGGLRAEAGEQLGAAALAVEDRGEELERRHEVGARAPALQRLGGALEARVVAGMVDERLPQRAFAAGGERQEIVVVETDERAFQHLGERQVVLRQGEELAERDEVGDGDLVAEPQAVGAGDVDAARLQGGHHRPGERAALAHQDEDVAGGDAAPFRRQHLAVVEPAADGVGDALGQPLGRRARGALVERRPRVDVVGVVGDLGRPHLDDTAMAQAMHRMAHDGGFARQARRTGVVAKDAVYRGEHRRYGAERQIERECAAR